MKKRTHLLALLLVVALLFTTTPMTLTAYGSGMGVEVDTVTSVPTSDEGYAKELELTQKELTSLRTKLLDAIKSYKKEIDISSYGVPKAAVKHLTNLLFKSDPETFHINEYSYYHDKGIVTRLVFEGKYLYDQQTYWKMLASCMATVEWMTYDLVDADLNDTQKALILHDRLAVWVEYDKENYERDTIPHLQHTMYGALVEGIAVCDGYSKAYAYLLKEVGIHSYLCVSQDLDHAWNIVELYGKRYHVDVTWDDPTWDVTGRVNHKNFLLSSEGIYATGHEASDYDTSPTDKKYEDWFWKDSHTAFQYLNNTIYYINNETAQLCKWEIQENMLYNLLSVEDVWPSAPGYHWTSNYARLSGDWDYLYYSLHNAVYKYDPVTGKTETLHYPDLSGGSCFSVFGMKVQGNYLYCDIYNTQVFDKNTKKQHQWVGWYRQNGAAYLVLDETPDKAIYGLGKSLNTKGLSVRVRYTDGTTDYINNYTVSGFDSSRLGTQWVTVSFGGRNAYFPVEIVAACGDVDDDGTITSTDARLALQLYAGKIGAEGLDAAMADVDGDGIITSTDARLVLQYYAGKIDRYPAKVG